MADKFEILKKHFGYTSFRKGQEELIDALLERKDVLGIMPTGAGKSMCYQIPAMPTTEKELLNVSGVGEKKLKSYGKDFLSVISKYKQEKEKSEQKLLNQKEKKHSEGYENAYEAWTKKETESLKSQFQIGLSIGQLAELHGRTKSAIKHRLKKEGLIK